MKFHIIIRFTDAGLEARSADFPQLTATGRSVQEVEDRLFDTIQAHLEELQAAHKWNELFEPRSNVASVEDQSQSPRFAPRAPSQ